MSEQQSEYGAAVEFMDDLKSGINAVTLIDVPSRADLVALAKYLARKGWRKP